MKNLARIFVSSLLISASASAAPVALGTQEVRLDGGIDLDSTVGTSVTINGGYGYFVADYVEVGGLVSLSNDDILTALGLGGFAEYNIETETEVLPFVGTQLRLIYADLDYGTYSESETALALGIYAGAKFFFTEELALSARFIVETATEDIYPEENGDVGNVDAGIEFGLRYFF